MTDNPVEWINRHIQVGGNLYAKGDGIQTCEETDAWEADAQRWWEEAQHGVKARNPQDATRLETISPFQPLDPSITWSSTAEGSPGNTPLSRHRARIERLEEIAHDWRANPPELPIPAAWPGRPGPDKPLKVRRIDWWYQMRDEMRKHPERTKKAIAGEIAAREDVTPEYVYREASRARTGR